MTGTKNIFEGRKEWLEHWLFILTLIASVIFFFSQPDQFVSDDSLFYLVIAEHIVHEGFSSFNGLIGTNGYHPIWMVFSIASVLIANFLHVDALVILGLFFNLLFIFSLYFIAKITRMIGDVNFPLVGILLTFVFISNGLLQNMESAIALLFVSIACFLMLHKTPRTHLEFCGLGVLLGLTVLSRLDLIFFGVLSGCVIVFINRGTLISSPTKLLVFILSGSAIFLPYLLFNYFYFDSILPISGKVKSSFPNAAFELRHIFPYGVLVGLTSIFALWLATRRTGKCSVVLSLLAGSSLIHLLYLYSFQDSMAWYYITGFLTTAIVFGYVFQAPRLGLISIFVVALGFTASIATAYLKLTSDYTLSTHLLRKKKLNFSSESQMKSFAEEVNAIVPNSEIVFTWDVPGALAYYGGYKIFSADGLISNMDYQKDLATMGLESMLEKYGISHILVPITDAKHVYYAGLSFSALDSKTYQLEIFSRLFGVKTGEINLTEDDLVGLIRSPYGGANVSSPKIGVFKIPTTKPR